MIFISSASEEDAATFTCEAQNGVKDSEGNVIVRVDVMVNVQGELLFVCFLLKVRSAA